MRHRFLTFFLLLLSVCTVPAQIFKYIGMEDGSPLQKSLNETTQITLKYDQNTFSINVSSINDDTPGNIYYSWKLEGFYDEWSTPSDFNLIRYTNLPPGNYTLKVRAILKSDQSVLEERSLPIIVETPFWFTSWAFLIYALAIIGLLYGWVRYQINSKIRNASQEKINFFIHTAHDIRTPLTLIKATLGEVLKHEQLSEQGKTYIQLAMQNTDNLSELANNLMNFQKEELYSSKASVSREELNSYLTNYLVPFQNSARQKGIDLQYTCKFQQLEVWIDRNKMDSILRNLITNAIKYTPEGGKVTLNVECSKHHWTLDISDTGIGIPQKEQKKIFKFLFRGSNTTNQLMPGVGIGMLLTYHLVHNHEGRITFSSTENTGTNFHLTFPIQSLGYRYKRKEEEGIQAPVIRQDALPDDKRKTSSCTDISRSASRILIVEDNPNMRSFLKQSLSSIYHIDEACNGQEALEKIKEHQPDLVLSDIMMPIMGGKELCTILKNNIETSHIAVILLTALDGREDIISGLKTHADLYIVKPFDPTVLEANIANLLGNRNLLRKKVQEAVFNLETIDEELGLLSPLDNEFVQKVTNFIKENLNNDLTIDTLCAYMHMSRTSFYNKMKALTDMAPNDYIRNIRMNEAARLLRSKQYTVSEISDLMGFADPKYFTDIFKKFYGVPPSTYMKQTINP